MSRNKNVSNVKPQKKKFSKRLKTIIYVVSLVVSIPVFVLLSIFLVDLVNEKRSYVFSGLLMIGFLAIYTWHFFFLIRRSKKHLLAYFISLIFVWPLLGIFSFMSAYLITSDPNVPLFFWLFTGLAAILVILFTKMFFNKIVPSFIEKRKTKTYNLVTERTNIRSHDRVKTVSLAGLWLLGGGWFALPLIIFGGAWLTSMMGWGGEVAWILIVSGLVFMFISYNYFYRNRLLKKRMHRTVLWLRRFHRDGHFPFDLVLEEICKGVALPLTIADSTVPNSKIAGYQHPLTNLGMALILISTIGGLPIIIDYKSYLIPSVVITLVILVGILLLIIGYRRGGQLDLRNKQGDQSLNKLFDAIDNELPVSSNIKVIRLDDENWQKWVGEFIIRADSVLIDVTHLNENLGWELKACRERLEPQSLVLACGKYKNSKVEPWSLLEPKLKEYLGANFLADCQRFTYIRPAKWNILAMMTILPGFRQPWSKYLRKKYEKDLLDSLSFAFEAKDDLV